MKNPYVQFSKYVANLRHRRSTEWPRVRRNWLKLHPVCEACGSQTDVEVHHVVPFHVDRSLELAAENLISLCESIGSQHHLRLGHTVWGRSGWSLTNPAVRSDTARARLSL